MDQIIELMTFYWADWQYTAIANTRYSAVLATLAFLIGGLIVSVLKRGKIVRLMRQVMQGKQQLENAEKTHEELLSKQKKDEAQIADVQQQLEQAGANLQKEKNEYQENILKKDELLEKSVAEKQQEVDAINTMLDEKNLFAERLQNELDEQKTKIAEYDEAQAKIAEMEEEIKQSAIELNAVKQQLDTELNNKSEQLEQSAKNHIDRVSELELQLKTISDVAEEEKMRQQAIIQQNKSNQIVQEKQKAEEKVKSAETKIKLENAVQQRDSQPEPVKASEKPQVQVKHADPLKQKAALDKESHGEKNGVVGQVLGWFSSMDKVLESDHETENDLEKQKNSLPNEINQALPQKQKQKQKLERKVDLANIEQTVQHRDPQAIEPSEKIQAQVKHAEPLKQKAVLAKEPHAEKDGVVSQVLGWFSSMDEALEGDVAESKMESVMAEEKIEQLAPVNQVKVERKPSIRNIPNPAPSIPEEEGSSFSEKLAEVADTMDSFQGRFKKFFRK